MRDTDLAALGTARARLEATVRYQLREAWERGLETAPHSAAALADAGAPAAFDAVMGAVDALGAALAGALTYVPAGPPPAGTG